MKNLKYILGVFLFITSGCSSFLDMKSNKSLVVVHSVEDALALLDDYARMNEMKVPGWGESVSDDYYLTDASFNLFSEYQQQFYLWNYQPHYGIGNDWGYGYQPIYNANLALDLLKNLPRTPENASKYDHAKGSALFFRSYYFYHLLVVYAQAYDENTAHEDLGIVLRLTSDFNVKSIRSSVKDCFNQIEMDLKASVDLLPNHPTFVSRASKAASFATLARLYLYKRDYQQALEYAELALAIKSDLMDYNGDDDILTTVSPTASPFKEFNKETIFYAECNAVSLYSSGVVDSILYQSFGISDKRRDLFFRVTNELPYFKGHYTKSFRPFGGLSINELYLIQAECLAVLSRTEEAVQTLDKLLEKRIENHQPFAQNSVSNQHVLDYIRMERRKELICRGLRFSDIKRYNKEGANIILKRVIGGVEYLLEPNSKKYALLLPSDLISITGIQQN